VDGVELKRAFRATVDFLLDEMRHADGALSAKLAGPLNLVAHCLDGDFEK
jgi:hypothetical protein